MVLRAAQFLDKCFVRRLKCWHDGRRVALDAEPKTQHRAVRAVQHPLPHRFQGHKGRPYYMLARLAGDTVLFRFRDV